MEIELVKSLIVKQQVGSGISEIFVEVKAYSDTRLDRIVCVHTEFKNKLQPFSITMWFIFSLEEKINIL
jgi:hypothetical protein